MSPAMSSGSASSASETSCSNGSGVDATQASLIGWARYGGQRREHKELECETPDPEGDECPLGRVPHLEIALMAYAHVLRVVVRREGPVTIAPAVGFVDT